MRILHSLTVSSACAIEVAGWDLASAWHGVHADTRRESVCAAAAAGRTKQSSCRRHLITVWKQRLRSDLSAARTPPAPSPHPSFGPLWRKQSPAQNEPGAATEPTALPSPAHASPAVHPSLLLPVLAPGWREPQSSWGLPRQLSRRRAVPFGIHRVSSTPPQYLPALAGARAKSPVQRSILPMLCRSRSPAPSCQKCSGFVARSDICVATPIDPAPLPLRV